MGLLLQNNMNVKLLRLDSDISTNEGARKSKNETVMDFVKS